MRKGFMFRRITWTMPLGEKVRRVAQDEMDKRAASPVDAALDELVGVATRLRLSPATARDILLILPQIPTAAFRIHPGARLRTVGQ